MMCQGERYKGKWWLLSEGSSVKGSPEDKQPSGHCIKGSAKISRRVTLAHYTGVIDINCSRLGEIKNMVVKEK